MAGCMAHARNGHISTSGLKSDVTIVMSVDDTPPKRASIAFGLVTTFSFDF